MILADCVRANSAAANSRPVKPDNLRVFHTFAESGTPAERKRAALDAAKKWVAEQGWYDGKWARNRMHDYVPVHVNKQFPLRKN
jgi:predicted metalloprotease with PDZ domain